MYSIMVYGKYALIGFFEYLQFKNEISASCMVSADAQSRNTIMIFCVVRCRNIEKGETRVDVTKLRNTMKLVESRKYHHRGQGNVNKKQLNPF